MFNQRLWRLHSFSVFLGLPLGVACYTVMCKSTPTLSAQSVHGGTQGREVIDLASAPTPWHRRWDGGREGRKERYITLLHLQPYSNLINLNLHFLLVY